MESCIRGFHVYCVVWTPYIGEQLDRALDSGNSKDPFAVAVQKDGETIGHVPRTISCVSSLFLRRRGQQAAFSTTQDPSYNSDNNRIINNTSGLPYLLNYLFRTLFDISSQ